MTLKYFRVIYIENLFFNNSLFKNQIVLFGILDSRLLTVPLQNYIFFFFFNINRLIDLYKISIKLNQIQWKIWCFVFVFAGFFALDYSLKITIWGEILQSIQYNKISKSYFLQKKSQKGMFSPKKKH